ncbi:MAG: chemotaxis protein CheR, partial [Desulfobacterales bacterium GWB2_56_26]
MTKKTRTAKQNENKTIEPPAENFPVVGIGASAGGLQAFEEFFSAMPADSGLAFVLITHLDPSQISILPELIQKKTGMKVFQAVDHMTIAPNHVYIIPPNRNLAIYKGNLQLFEVDKPRGTNMPIDSFLRSLAQDRGNGAIAIILSGTGTDGTLGIRAIKGEAGLVMVQDPQTAGFDGMPRNAIATGAADYVLSPRRMTEKLSEYVRYRRPAGKKSVSNDEKMAGALQKIYHLLRTATSRDFSQYKRNTICRRIERRMSLQRIDDIDDYVRYLQDSEVEMNILYKELLIGVTSFFRDPAAFELLKEKYLPELLRDKPDDYQVRVWVPGCSSGEEAYSIAIVLRECMEALGRHFLVQIFGTDLDEDAIGVARGGRYPESIVADLTPERLAKFFVRDEKRYTVAKTIREMVVFAVQDIIKDPPFTKLDLLCCRNLLIYFGPQLQDKLLPVFHYSLKPNGLLFLGSSETIGHTSDIFAVLDKKWKIFKRLPASSPDRPPVYFPLAEAIESAGPAGQPDKGNPQPAEQSREVRMEKLLKTVLAHSDMPPCVIVDGSANIIYVHGRTGRYLEPAEGEVSSNLLEMARPGLRPGLISAFRRMATERREIILKKLRIEESGGYCELNLVIRPLPDLQIGLRSLMMVIFDEVAGARERAGWPSPSGRPEKSEEVKRLEDDLQYTRENLQITIEELETSNEELKSANEELQSTNEELQSTNEEMETSKEELQSLNEESVTVNAELQSRIDELVAANDDIRNLLDATDIATIFLDINLDVRRFTPKSTELFHLTGADIDRPIEHFATTLKDVRLVEKARTVLSDLSPHESEAEDHKGRRYRMRVRPYRTSNNVIAGVVITFENISKYRELVDA